MSLLLFALILCALPCFKCAGLIDNPIVGDSTFYLDGANWTLSDGTRQVKANIPGDIISDLFNAGIVGDPLFETNWLDDSPVWAGNTWTYTRVFQVTDLSAQEYYLNFDGIKMGATISLNGKVLGQASDQFLRYTFAVKTILRASNTLTIVFQKGIGGDIDCNGRFMACTGGWDWSPYSNTFDSHGSHTLSFGIWKSVYITAVNTAAIEHLVPHVSWTGPYPTTPLTKSSQLSFTVAVTVHFRAPASASGTLIVRGQWGQQASQAVQIPAGMSKFQLNLQATDADGISLWWPNGVGEHPLYSVTATFNPTSPAGKSISDSRNIGFRVFALVTADDSDPSKIAGKDGSGTLTMRFKINGANMFMRGGNMIPMENYEQRANADAFRILVNSAADAHYNVFRIWGGGIFLYDEFYDQCDKQGIVMYHDMMYAQGGHFPRNTDTQLAELNHNLRRLSHHPSIVMWDGCNECGGQGIYNDFVVTSVVAEDQSRVVWPSCPADGYVSGVDMLWGLPNGKKLVVQTKSEGFETHGPYQHGTGFKTVDDPSGQLEMFSPNLPPNLQVGAQTGPSLPGKYASEFGCAGMSSFESMSETLKPEHWTVHSPPMSQRNYPCDNIIEVYFGLQNFSDTGEIPFKRQLYQCLIGQALELKSDIEVRRSWNEWATITWQINEIWPTGGWGSIEYGTPTIGGGQVIGGRWKPLHHWLAGPVFADLISTCSAADPPQCFIKNDGIPPFTGKVVISVTKFSDGSVIPINTIPVSLGSGAGVIQWFCAKSNGGTCASWNSILSSAGCQNGAPDCIVTTSIIDSNGITVSENFVPLTTPLHMNLPTPTITFTVESPGTVTLKSDHVAMFVTLTTRAQGRFSENAFIMYPGTKSITFNWFGTPDTPTLAKTLRIEHAQMYITPPGNNLAFGRPCKASSFDDNSRTCPKAFDDDLSTRWSSNYTDSNWIYVDLGSQQKISSVVLYWEDAYAKSFAIQTSNDENNWTTQYSTNSGNGGVSTIPLTNVNARWVKMTASARGTEWGYSFWEFQIF